ncbi:glycoside hydrolase family 76 protein [Aplosporella prunicola CBS 121167]|uniref:Mannan endo-1,6-alpha-mannosidase n=1 Tax=Aplosporella prunicola CBS 121167 TaxID=1176127 RepID=A0A6A6AZF9_9PEZI|nr:glycoside hydrolase family 76 protein [Aplosporella prunicola CBS 121167]KAF2136167.1 glycoside hydrolase family 76 protein [Aplosporella prunicola CBS 121167]
MKGFQRALTAVAAVLLVPSLTSALTFSIDDPASIRSAAASVAQGLLKLYIHNTTDTPAYLIGTFDKPIYWWEAGAVWGGLVDYWTYTGDASHVDTTKKALLAQAGPQHDYMNAEWKKELGNDDQAFWALGAMSALEGGFSPPAASEPSWLDLAVNTFNSQIVRWDTSTCDGGLRWQIFTFNNGYDYKNSISNGELFQLAARLARYTGNQTYADWALKVWNWSTKVGFIDAAYNVFDGAQATEECGNPTKYQWSYNVGVYLYGAAVMYNHTDGDAGQGWKQTTEGLLQAAKIFFGPSDNATNIMYEATCEPYGTCNTDQLSFKAYLAQWMAKTSVLAPFTKDTIQPLLQASAQGAAAACSGGEDGETCGYRWDVGFDGNSGLGQQLAALEVIQSLLVSEAPAPAVQGSPAST